MLDQTRNRIREIFYRYRRPPFIQSILFLIVKGHESNPGVQTDPHDFPRLSLCVQVNRRMTPVHRLFQFLVQRRHGLSLFECPSSKLCSSNYILIECRKNGSTSRRIVSRISDVYKSDSHHHWCCQIETDALNSF